MDPLTIGFEEALHRANRAPEESSDPTGHLARELQRVLDASPHRLRGAVSISVEGPGQIRLRRAGGECDLRQEGGAWRLASSRGPTWSGPLAAALTEWLTR